MSEVDLSKAVVGQQGITGGGEVATLKSVGDEYHWSSPSMRWSTTVNGRACGFLGHYYDITSLLPLAPAPASAEPGDVITGPGMYRTARYDRTGDIKELAEVVGRSSRAATDPWLGIIGEVSTRWQPSGHNLHGNDWSITGPYTEPPDPTRDDFNRLCDLLSSGDRDGAWKVFSEKGGGV